MKIFTSAQIRQLDEYTIQKESIASADLMERAAQQLLGWILARFDRSRRIYIFAGPGNNGGDGLALARMLAANRYEVDLHLIEHGERISVDCEINLKRLGKESEVRINYLVASDQFPYISSNDIIIDAIFGTGIKRRAEGVTGDVIRQINNTGATIISVDIPSGLFCEDNSQNTYETVVKATYTLSFEFPKLSFMFAENAHYAGNWEILPIGLDDVAVTSLPTPYSFTTAKDVAPLIKTRNRFDHKGNFGHGLLVSGSAGKMGSSILGAGGALRSGIGLITCHIPSRGEIIVQSAVPEAMVRTDIMSDYVSNIDNIELYSAIGIGPGIGTDPVSQKALYNLLTECKKPIVIDADALNILSANKKWLSLLPDEAVLTPHPKEFERLTEKTENGYTRLMLQIEFSKKYKCIVILKGANTSVTTPDGKVWFNSTGNPGMATAGSGDVLTGIILSLLAQGYQPQTAAVIAVYLHGMAGDIAAEGLCYESLIASDIINSIWKAFNRIGYPVLIPDRITHK